MIFNTTIIRKIVKVDDGPPALVLVRGMCELKSRKNLKNKNSRRARPLGFGTQEYLFPRKSRPRKSYPSTQKLHPGRRASRSFPRRCPRPRRPYDPQRRPRARRVLFRYFLPWRRTSRGAAHQAASHSREQIPFPTSFSCRSIGRCLKKCDELSFLFKPH